MQIRISPASWSKPCRQFFAASLPGLAFHIQQELACEGFRQGFHGPIHVSRITLLQVVLKIVEQLLLDFGRHLTRHPVDLYSHARFLFSLFGAARRRCRVSTMRGRKKTAVVT